MNMKKILSIIAAGLLAACAVGTNVLDNKSFRLTELNGTEYVPQTEEGATISFSDGNCYAYLGGNRISASYKEGKNGALTLGHSLMTRMLVPQEFREDEFVDALNSAASFKIENGTVSFYNGEGELLFKAVEE